MRSFSATVIAEGSALGWRIVDVPFDVKEVFGQAGRVSVKGTVNGYAFRSSLFARKNGPHFLMLNKAMQKGAGVRKLGEKVTVTLELDQDERIVEMPDELAMLLEEEPEILEFFNRLNYSTRKWMIDQIVQPKSDAARQRRAERIAMQLVEIRDGEIDPPPILKALFAQHPNAAKGWQKMPPTRKRGELFGIFASQNPATRQRRAERALEMILAYAEK